MIRGDETAGIPVDKDETADPANAENGVCDVPRLKWAIHPRFKGSVKRSPLVFGIAAQRYISERGTTYEKH